MSTFRFSEDSSETGSTGSSRADGARYSESGKRPSWSAGEAGDAGDAGEAPPPPSGSKGRQKKFHRHFPQASMDERVLNYYSCALVGDILLQGHLYITKNYFAFYSNVFGYVTKLLIPLSSVVRVTKEKMARIIPNAVGVTTADDKHVFGSLLSRDTTYKLMTLVWKASHAYPPPAPAPEVPLSLDLPERHEALDPHETHEAGASELSLDEESSWCSQSGGEERAPLPGPLAPLPQLAPPAPPSPRRRPAEPARRTVSSPRRRSQTAGVAAGAAGVAGVAPRDGTSPSALAILGALLMLSAAVLLYRLSATPHTEENVLMIKRGDDVYGEILKWHSQLHSKSALEVREFLHSNLEQIAKVRQSLESLSALIAGIIADKLKSPLDATPPSAGHS